MNHILITGANSGIAQALYQIIGQQNNVQDFQVTLVSRDYQGIAITESEAQNKLQSLKTNIIKADFTNSNDVKQVFETLNTQGIPVTHYFHCLGNTCLQPLPRNTDEQIQQVLSLNLISSLYGLRGYVEHCKAHKVEGSALFFSSVVAQMGVGQHELISAAKAGIEGMVRSAAATYALQKIRINAIAPGLTETPMTQGMLKNEMVKEAVGKQYPLGGITSALEVAQAAWFLANANRITGQILPVDAGFTAVRPLVK